MRNLPSGWRNSHFGISESGTLKHGQWIWLEGWTMDLLYLPNLWTTQIHPRVLGTPPILGQGGAYTKVGAFPTGTCAKTPLIRSQEIQSQKWCSMVLYKLHPTSAEELGSLCIVLPWQTWTTMAQMGIQWVYCTTKTWNIFSSKPTLRWLTAAALQTLAGWTACHSLAELMLKISDKHLGVKPRKHCNQ